MRPARSVTVAGRGMAPPTCPEAIHHCLRIVEAKVVYSMQLNWPTVLKNLVTFYAQLACA